MADTKLSGLTAAGAAAGADLLYTVQGGTSFKQTITAIQTFILATPTITGHPTVEGVTSTGATGTGNLVFSASPTLSGTVGGALTFSGTHTLSAALTYGGVTLSNSVTGTGSMVLSAAPTITGHPTVEGVTSTGATGTGNFVFSAAPTLTGHPTIEGVTSTGATGTGNFVFSASPTLSGTVGGALTFSGALTLSSALTYGGVTLSNAVTGTGNMVLSAAPTITGHPVIEGVTSTGATGTGNFVFSASPTLSGTVTGPDAGTWTSAGLNSIAGIGIGVAAASNSLKFGVNGSASAPNIVLNSTNTGIYSTGANIGFTVGGTIVFDYGIGIAGQWSIPKALVSSVSAKPGLVMNSTGSNYGQISNVSSNTWSVGYGSSSSNLGTAVISWTDTNSIVLGSAAIATNATDGFLYIPTCAGTPTGVPTSKTGRVALVYDTTNHQFWIYDGAWLQPKTPAAASIVNWQ
jgi:hypothetical protein